VALPSLTRRLVFSSSGCEDFALFSRTTSLNYIPIRAFVFEITSFFNGVEMASTTASVSVTCPNCAKVLRLSARPAKGKNIKCPSCGEAFLPELDDEETGIQEKPGAKAKASSSKSASKRSRDEDDGPPQRRKRHAQDEDDEEEDDKPFRKKKAKKSGSMLMIVLLLVGGGLLFLSCGAVGLTAFVWPGFMLTKTDDKKVAQNRQEGKEEKAKPAPVIDDKGNDRQAPVNVNIASYILPDANMAMGANLKGLRDSNQIEIFNGIIEFALQGNQQGNMPAQVADVLRDCEKVVLTGNAPMGQQMGGPNFGGPRPGGGAPPIKVAIAALLPANAIAKIKGLPGMGAEEKLAGKYSIYRLTGNGKRMILAFPGDQVLVLGEVTDAEMTTMLDNAARNPANADQLAKMSAMVESSHFWFSFKMDADGRRQMQGVDQMLAGKPGVPQQAIQGMQAMQKVKGGCIAVDAVPGGNWKLQLNLDFDDANAASSVKDTADALKKLALDKIAEPQQPPVPPSVQADVNTLSFTTQGTLVSGTLSVSAQTIAAAKAEMGGGGFAKEPLPKKDGTRDLAKKDGNPKNPPPFDGNPKSDLPKSDGIKEIPKGGPGVQTYTVSNLFAGKTNDRPFIFQQRQRVRITVNNTLSTPTTDVNLIVFRGTMKDSLKSDMRPPGLDKNCFVEFIAPATDTYRISIENRGPGIARSCRVTVTVQ
jgi:predicted RNA-binding Zn-ribbon protein involved in translation (DUF1610 family)